MSSLRKSIRNYYSLTKPGIIYGNVLTTIGGFLFAAKGVINVPLFIAVILGTALVIAASCIFNNYLDRDIDHKMSRTKNRCLVTGEISEGSALMLGTILMLSGISILIFFTNLLTAIVGMLGAFFYIIVYYQGKRFTKFGTEIGSISGALPIVGGYTAVTNHLDLGAILLFLILIFWQMPHFYAIALFRMKEYEAAGIPVVPLVRGIPLTKILLTLYLLGFCLLAASLTFFGYTTNWYLFMMGVVSLYWLSIGIRGFKVKSLNSWARKVFLTSLIIILVFSLLISIDHYLPH